MLLEAIIFIYMFKYLISFQEYLDTRHSIATTAKQSRCAFITVNFKNI